MISLQLLGYPAALAMGLTLGLSGSGGAILSVPIFVYLFKINAFDATLYSLGVVGLLAAWGAFKAHLQKQLLVSLALGFGFFGILGMAFSRHYLLKILPNTLPFNLDRDSFLLICFGIMMFIAALSMIRSPNKQQQNNIFPNLDFLTPFVRRSINTAFTGFAIGSLAGFVGAGGGFLIVPTLHKKFKLSIKTAMGTSLLIIAIQSLFGFLSSASQLKQIRFDIFTSVIALAFIGMGAGIKIREKTSPEKLKTGFGYFVLSMGALIIFFEIRKGSL